MTIGVSHTHLVTRDEVSRFAHAIGETAPIHHDVETARAAGYRDLLAPDYFFSTLSLSLGRNLPRDALAKDGLPFSDDLAGFRVVAGETRVQWHADICAGDLVSYSSELVNREVKFGRSGELHFLTYLREFSVDSSLAVSERITRIGRA